MNLRFYVWTSRREPAIVVGNILCAKTIMLILYGRKVYEISVHRQESRNLAVLSQFTSKSLQPNLQTFSSNRTALTVYTTDLDSMLISHLHYLLFSCRRRQQNDKKSKALLGFH